MSDDNSTINITSYHQSGGITAHTVNVGKNQRVLNDISKSKIIDIIDFDWNVDITSAMGDQEAFIFANEIAEFLTSSGYNISGVSVALFGKPLVGQSAIIHETKKRLQILIGSQSS